MEKVLDIFEKCKRRWEIEQDTENAFQRYPEWLGKMPEELAEIVNSLMPGFDYYTHQNVNKELVALHEKLQKMQGVEFENTIYCVLPNKEGRLNSGYEYIIEYRMLNRLSCHVVIPNLKEMPKEDLDYIENIVFVDDFGGSGKTFKDYIMANKDIMRDKHIYYLVVHVMEKALKKIEELRIEAKLNISVLYGTCTPAAFERNFQPAERRKDFKRLSVEYGLPEKNVLGYKNTEALVAFYNNTPNNTLPIFWKDVEGNKALFPRNDDEKPSWKMMKRDKELRSESNYLRKSRNDRRIC